MKNISKLLKYDNQFLDQRVPDAARILPSPDRDYPFYVKENLLPADLCDDIVEFCLNKTHSRAMIGAERQASVDERIRKTSCLTMTREHWMIYRTAVNGILNEVGDFFSMGLRETSETTALGYFPGGHYIQHADNCVSQQDRNGALVGWKLTLPHRTLSSILYLTDGVSEITGPNQCVGGNLGFNYLLDASGDPFLVEPKKGLFLAFPSNPYFSHTVYEVFAGFRAAIVAWYSRV